MVRERFQTKTTRDGIESSVISVRIGETMMATVINKYQKKSSLPYEKMETLPFPDLLTDILKGPRIGLM
jgi:hypothetical protein